MKTTVNRDVNNNTTTTNMTILDISTRPPIIVYNIIIQQLIPDYSLNTH